MTNKYTNSAKSFHEVLRQNAMQWPDRTYAHCIDQCKSISYGALYSVSNRAAHFFQSRELKANDRVLLLAENSVENLTIFISVLRFGATLATVHVEMNRVHLSEIIRAISPKIVLFQENIGLEELQFESPGEWIAIGNWQKNKRAMNGFFSDLTNFSDKDDIESVASPHNHGIIFYTSGTVAKPKGVIQTHETAYYNYDATADYLELLPGDRVFDCRSYSWLSAQHMSLGAPLVSGATVVMAKRFSKRHFFDWLKSSEANVGFVVPTIVNMLINRPEKIRGDDLPHLRFLTSSSAPLLDEQWRTFEKLYGIKLAQSCGSSEGGNTAAHRGSDRKIGTIGPAQKYQDIRIVDVDGKGLPQGETGEIIIGGGKQQAYGYLLMDGTIERLPEDGHHSGDLGFFDEDRHLHITGRLKELIIRGGMNIAPLEIDAVLIEHPDIIEAGTIGVPHPIYGEEVVSYIVCRPGNSFSCSEIIDFCKSRLSEPKIPKIIYTLEQLPKNSRGKLDRSAIVSHYRKNYADSIVWS